MTEFFKVTAVALEGKKFEGVFSMKDDTAFFGFFKGMLTTSTASKVTFEACEGPTTELKEVT